MSNQIQLFKDELLASFEESLGTQIRLSHFK